MFAFKIDHPLSSSALFNHCYLFFFIPLHSLGRADFTGIDNAALDFSQLEDYINDEDDSSSM